MDTGVAHRIHKFPRRLQADKQAEVNAVLKDMVFHVVFVRRTETVYSAWIIER